MQPIFEDEAAAESAGIAKRKLLVPIDDSSESEKALAWAMEEMYREGDEIHLVHVVPKLQMGACFGAPPVDFLPQQDPIAYDQLVKQAEAFIQMRFLPSLNSLRVHPIVHIVKAEVDTESIGTVLCRKAESLDAAAIVVSCEARSRLQEFFLGSITNFCTHHSKRPVLVVK
ncbi:hypothetical protein CVIRNUC_007367 [Coccomyxa viridis]|uniref:UspA domain-containing protein n=1 Tax=Coccomyxa viridis TaxID=1274662 RepID=A0AAV1IAQ6_9CHLO|nr:hypothetical protein CVIRNUC_007367 [Coccomyxa viridis]